jgi:hypothetical protein
MVTRIKATLIGTLVLLSSFNLLAQVKPEEKNFTVQQLKEDFFYLRSVLEKNHPRLYEFTPKKKFDRFMDSLYAAIRRPMNEIEFRYFLLPAFAKIHCAHTSLKGSDYLSANSSELRYPPFKLYYENGKAYLQYNFSADSSLTVGSEVLAINNVPVKAKIHELKKRVTGDGIHESVQYSIINDIMVQTDFREYYNTEDYKVELIDKNRIKRNVHLKAITWNYYKKLAASKVQRKRREFKIMDSGNTGLLVLPSFNYQKNPASENFLAAAFKELKEKKVDNLVLDLRGNGGGPPDLAVELLTYLMKNDFVYFTDKAPAYSQYKKTLSVSENRFTGKVYCLIDGGCGSTTGHFLSFFKFYNLGPLLGELSSATFSGNGNGIPHSLTNTALTLYCPPAIYETTVKGLNRAKGIPPDYEITYKIEDVLAGKDRTLEFTLKLIANSSKLGK